MSAGFFKGTSLDQDSRFQKNHAKRKSTIKFPAIFDTKVDMKRVNREAFKQWTAKMITELFDGLEDELLINYVNAFLDLDEIDPREMQLSVSDMLEKDTSAFMKELWTMLVDAQTSTAGIPKALIDSTQGKIEARINEVTKVLETAKNTVQVLRQSSKTTGINSGAAKEAAINDAPSGTTADMSPSVLSNTKEASRLANEPRKNSYRKNRDEEHEATKKYHGTRRSRDYRYLRDSLSNSESSRDSSVDYHYNHYSRRSRRRHEESYNSRGRSRDRSRGRSRGRSLSRSYDRFGRDFRRRSSIECSGHFKYSDDSDYSKRRCYRSRSPKYRSPTYHSKRRKTRYYRSDEVDDGSY
ncbi:uncharacterized protein LOC126326572 [Schistocerca gregaria]|uniref:uncharacterized protein LOC126326572 n=1 Tax=Schistocerca gregaria TaxID=7010 RepID=UPI00211DDBC0|nr:uncharacterized protein LOC126326572 [Schistocerca gregaria]